MRAAVVVAALVLAAAGLIVALVILVFVIPLHGPPAVPPTRPEPSSLVACAITTSCGANAYQR